MNTRVHLTLRSAPTMPVEANGLLPEAVTGKTQAEIEGMPLLVGNRTETVGEHFLVEISEVPDASKGEFAELVLTGDLTRFKSLGEDLNGGTMIVEGPVGFHAGAEMTGGLLVIKGDTGDYLGAEMTGGKIVVHGNAGHFTGSAYRGALRGMSGGTILIHGNAGNLTGARIRSGVIVVKGRCGDLAGYSMGAGTILIGGEAGVRAGANMVRGTVILLSPPEAMMPTFRYNSTGKPGFWPLLLNTLTEAECELPGVKADSLFRSYSGDINEGGRGEVLLYQPSA